MPTKLSFSEGWKTLMYNFISHTEGGFCGIGRSNTRNLNFELGEVEGPVVDCTYGGIVQLAQSTAGKPVKSLLLRLTCADLIYTVHAPYGFHHKPTNHSLLCS